MTCFKDRTFCKEWDKCKNGDTCKRAFKPEIEKEAIEAYERDRTPTCWFIGTPECFESKEIK